MYKFYKKIILSLFITFFIFQNVCQAANEHTLVTYYEYIVNNFELTNVESIKEVLIGEGAYEFSSYYTENSYSFIFYKDIITGVSSYISLTFDMKTNRLTKFVREIVTDRNVTNSNFCEDIFIEVLNFFNERNNTKPAYKWSVNNGALIAFVLFDQETKSSVSEVIEIK